ncbi:MAG: MFS transporter [Actinomycetota bacterium]|nr:MFS transporter [Actinomycetota bacterium]
MSTSQISNGRARRARIGAATCFLLTGFIFATFASRVPAVKENLGLTDGQLAIGFVGLNAGAILGLQLGGMLVPRTGSRPALVVALLAFAGVLLLPAVVPNLPTLVAALLLLAVFNSVVDVAMNAQGVTVQKLMGHPVLSGMHAMHSLGGVLGAGAGALAAHLDAGPLLHFLATTAVAGMASLAVSPLLLPSREDAEDGPSVDGHGAVTGMSKWFRGWSLPMAVIGALAFCFTLAEGAALDWSAVYVSDSLGGSASLSAVGLGVFLGAVTLGRLAGDRLVSRFGAVRVFWVGAVTAGAGFGSALLMNTPPAGVVGLGLLGAGIANALPLAISAGGNAPGEAPATAAARVSTFAYLGSFVGPALIGALATVWSLPLALALPAVLVLATAFGARAVRRAG